MKYLEKQMQRLITHIVTASSAMLLLYSIITITVYLVALNINAIYGFFTFIFGVIVATLFIFALVYALAEGGK